MIPTGKKRFNRQDILDALYVMAPQYGEFGILYRLSRLDYRPNPQLNVNTAIELLGRNAIEWAYDFNLRFAAAHENGRMGTEWKLPPPL